MKDKLIIEDGIVAGNYYPKYSTQNFLAKKIVSNFLHSLDRLVETVQPTSIHEVGCGEGHLISRYVAPGRKLIASDFSEQIVNIGRELAVQRGLAVHFNVKSIYSLTPESDAANLILCCEVFEHLERPKDALEVLTKLSNPYLIVSVPREPLWRVLNMARGMYLRDFGNTPGHLQHWSKDKFLHFIKQRFEIMNVQSPLPWTLILARVKSSLLP